jgi:hypothetical protein
MLSDLMTRGFLPMLSPIPVDGPFVPIPIARQPRPPPNRRLPAKRPQTPIIHVPEPPAPPPVDRKSVRFIDPRLPGRRRYASWDEITEYGRWAWESQERPVYV